MIRVLLVDDEERSLINLKSIIEEEFRDLKIVGSAQNIFDAQEYVKNTEIDVVFLDIEMPGGSGLDLIAILKDKNIEVIFITAFEMYAKDAFLAHALHFLLKPVDLKELNYALSILKAKRRNRENGIETRHNKFNKDDYIEFPPSSAFGGIKKSNIHYIHSKGAYTEIYLQNHRKITLSKNIGEIEKTLSQDFIRIHKQYIVNLNEVLRFIPGRGGKLLLQNGKELPISIRRKKKVLEKVKFFL